MVGWPLDHKADPNQQCVIDPTPVPYAMESTLISVNQLLLRRCGDVQKENFSIMQKKWN